MHLRGRCSGVHYRVPGTTALQSFVLTDSDKDNGTASDARLSHVQSEKKDAPAYRCNRRQELSRRIEMIKQSASKNCVERPILGYVVGIVPG